MATRRGPSVLLLDIDGTVVNYRLEVPPGAADALRAVRGRGHLVYLCTGRSRAEIYPHLWELGVDGLIGGNGSYVEDGDLVVFHQVLDPVVVQRAVDWMLERDLGFYLECNAGLFGSDNLPEKAAAILGGPTPENVAFVRNGFPDMIYGAREGRDDVNKISFVLEDGIDLDALARDYAGEASIDTWSMTGNGPEFGEFGQLGIHKGGAVRRLAEHLGADARRPDRLR
ncbi:MAG: HAD hydrolase family protein [Micropruina sp.]|nr:HAD hydrolase family protein [Micropruina sp.]